MISSNKGETIETKKFDTIQIEQNEIKYDLNIESKRDDIIFSINDKSQFPSFNYTRLMNFKEIKDLNKVFSLLNSFNDFYDYLKSLSINKKLNIKKNNDKISIIFFVEVLLKQQEIEIYLFPEKKDLDLSIKEIYKELLNVKEEINYLKNENKKLNKDVEFLKNENKELRNKIEKQNKQNLNLNEDRYYIDKSVIMKEDERNLILSEIEKKMNKKIKIINKLYQATIDGGDPAKFHSKCDNKPNTLVIIKSQDQKRFGGFTPIPLKLDEKGVYEKDNEKKTFIFSLDDKKIFTLNVVYDAVFHRKDCGPCFGRGWDIGIEGNPINDNKLWVFRGSFDYSGYNSSLSECNYKNKGKALEYEVFQVIFN